MALDLVPKRASLVALVVAASLVRPAAAATLTSPFRARLRIPEPQCLLRSSHAVRDGPPGGVTVGRGMVVPPPRSAPDRPCPVPRAGPPLPASRADRPAAYERPPDADRAEADG